MIELRNPVVTGGAGFIGSNLVKRLSDLEEVETIYCLDLPNSPRFNELRVLPKVKIIESIMSNCIIN